MKSNDLMDVLITAKLINSVKKTYSEEEVMNLLDSCLKEYSTTYKIDSATLADWFEQNKKK